MNFENNKKSENTPKKGTDKKMNKKGGKNSSKKNSSGKSDGKKAVKKFSTHSQAKVTDKIGPPVVKLIRDSDDTHKTVQDYYPKDHYINIETLEKSGLAKPGIFDINMAKGLSKIIRAVKKKDCIVDTKIDSWILTLITKNRPTHWGKLFKAIFMEKNQTISSKFQKFYGLRKRKVDWTGCKNQFYNKNFLNKASLILAGWFEDSVLYSFSECPPQLKFCDKFDFAAHISGSFKYLDACNRPKAPNFRDGRITGSAYSLEYTRGCRDLIYMFCTILDFPEENQRYNI